MVRRAHLDALPRLGWVNEPTPITPLPELASELGLGWVGVKRDDLCSELQGGTKVRKLDFVLAAPRFASASEWVSVGAIGSGHLATLTAAARARDRKLLALTFWEPLGEWVEENLAFTASGPAELHYFSNRLSLALRHPRALTASHVGDRAVVLPGASCGLGMLGMVRAGLELAEQVQGGELPSIDRIYLPLGTGGAAVGLSLGLALGGVRPLIVAVSAVELLFARAARLAALRQQTLKALADLGVDLPDHLPETPIRIERSMLGKGYGHATEESLRERKSLAPFGIGLEPIYGGKAMAALRADAPLARGERVLFWHTSHRGTLPHERGWEDRLPRALRRRLEAARSGAFGRRKWIAIGAAATVGGVLAARLGFHADLSGWEGHSLFEWEGAVLAAAAEALVPDAPGRAIPGGVSGTEIALNVDRYLRGASEKMRLEVHGLFAVVEHGTALDGNLARFTRLSPRARRTFIEALIARDDELGQAAKGLRELTYLGYYQDARSWPAIDYRGPWVPSEPRDSGPYESLVAPIGAAPPGRLS